MKDGFEAWVRALPKADLHLHLDGSLRAGTLLELADAQDLPLPAADVTGLMRDVFPERYESLPHYLAGFRWTTAVMKTPESVERIARELAEDCRTAGVVYAEVRFAPSLCATAEFPETEVLGAAARGLGDGAADDFRFGLIACGLRHESPEASLAAARTAITARQSGLPVVGFDLAGPESGFPAQVHREACVSARDAGLGLTVHAGEDAGPDSVREALSCGAARLGHGVRAAEDPALLAELAAAGTPLEVCLTSNRQTHPDWDAPGAHPLRTLLGAGVTVTLNTDNTLVSRTDLAQEALAAAAEADLQPEALAAILRGAFDHAFFPGSSSDRAAWLRGIDAAYAAVGG